MESGFFMNKNEQVEFEILSDFQEGRKTRRQAAMLLGVSERAVSRRTKKLREQGLRGIKHGNYAKSPSNKISTSLKDEVLALIKSRYYDFNISHAHELLREEHGFTLSYMTLLKWCRDSGLGNRKKRRTSKARIQRERMANEGVLLQMDGSHHKWNGKDTWCLISVIDDATSNIPAGQFYHGETSWNCMHLLRRLFTDRGVPKYLYTDGAGWAGGGGKRQNFSQVVRACKELGIEIIRAHSAEAKGRIERSYKTIQGRLIPEMRLKGITTMKDANRFLDQVYWTDWSRRYSVEPRDEIDRYRRLKPSEDLDKILCIKNDRQITSDHSISYGSKRYKVNPGKYGSLKKKTVTVHEYEDKTFTIYYGAELVEYQEIKIPKRKWI